ncbi:MAG: hypothetical protein AAF443_08585 [Chlamydiota bacterium]
MDKKLKEGISVQELENFGKKYQFEIFFVLYFVLATLLSFLFFGPGWSIFLCGIGAVLGILMPDKMDKAAKAAFGFVAKQEKVTKLILGVAGAIISFFLPQLIFFVLGLMGGKGIYNSALTMGQKDSEGSEPPVG